MKKALFALLLALAGNSYAGTAMLLSCTPGTSVTGRMVWVGTYSYFGRTFQRAFEGMCPFQIEVF